MASNLQHAFSQSAPSQWFLESTALKESNEARTEFPDRSNMEDGASVCIVEKCSPEKI